MNILICAGNLKRQTGYNLVPRYTAIALKNLNHNVAILALKKPTTLLENEAGVQYIELRGIKSLTTFKKVKTFNPNIIYTHSISLTDFFGKNYAHFKNVLLFSMVHTKFSKFLDLIVSGNSVSTKKLSSILEKLSIKQLKRSTKVFALTHDMEEYLNSLGVKNTVVVSNGVNLDEFIPNNNLKLNKNEINLIYVGAIGNRKNQIYLVKMAEYLNSGIKLHLAGGGKMEWLYYLRFLTVLNENKKKNVIYHGEVPHEDVSNLYKSSHIYVSASLLEAQSLSQIEAIATGLPTVRLLGKNTKGITSEKTAIHLPESTKPEQFAENINKLVNDGKRYFKMRKSVLKDREKYSWEKTAEKIVDIMSEYL